MVLGFWPCQQERFCANSRLRDDYWFRVFLLCFLVCEKVLVRLLLSWTTILFRVVVLYGHCARNSMSKEFCCGRQKCSCLVEGLIREKVMERKYVSLPTAGSADTRIMAPCTRRSLLLHVFWTLYVDGRATVPCAAQGLSQSVSLRRVCASQDDCKKCMQVCRRNFFHCCCCRISA